ncbi:putative HlyD family secretion protein [Alteromonas sp. 38]|uniref:HlyD family secretion protein n=1 Tax=Alteromonas TaxID=226 RepID=UPI0012F2C901|nr:MULTISPECIES: HlyD family efflux transporter periplasmic adaptor subunit [Alteromonas]CAD5256028.1 putative HlyD family secretion protein [Alteromonas sp. 154]VXA95374.1 putative HlyD family secretion protein [Alteromonas sp. 38]
MKTVKKTPFVLVFLLIVLVVLGFRAFFGSTEPEGVASSNGRIEAIEIGISAKVAGRVEEIFVDEGEQVEAGMLVAKLDTTTIRGQLRQANAQRVQAQSAVAAADMAIAQRESEKVALQAALIQTEAELKAAQAHARRTNELSKTGAVSKQLAEDNLTTVESAKAAVNAASARLAAADATIEASKSQYLSAKAAVTASDATIAQIESEIDDMLLKAPRNGRIQYRVVQPGEVVAAGGRVLSLVDLTNVYMTFYLPATQVGRLSIGSDARIVLDAAPDVSIPANISYVADVAQFTPRSVETESEREKLMFRVKAQIPKDLLQKYIEKVKTGLPGVVWVKLDDSAAWPSDMPELVAL